MRIGDIEKIGDREMPGWTPPAPGKELPRAVPAPTPEKAPAKQPVKTPERETEKV